MHALEHCINLEINTAQEDAAKSRYSCASVETKSFKNFAGRTSTEHAKTNLGNKKHYIYTS